MIQGSFKGLSSKFQGEFKSLARMFHGCFFETKEALFTITERIPSESMNLCTEFTKNAVIFLESESTKYEPRSQPAKPHRLENPKWPLGVPKWPMGSEKMSIPIPRFLGAPVVFN